MLVERTLRKAHEVAFGMKSIFLVALLFSLFTTSATAKDLAHKKSTATPAATVAAPTESTSKLYATIDIGRSTTKDSCFKSTGNCSESGIAYRIGVGYQYDSTWGIEASYRMRGGASSSQGSFTTEMLPTAIQVSIVGKYPVNQNLSLLGNLGIVLTSAEYNVNGTKSTYVSERNTKPAFGIGILYDLSKRIGLRFQYEKLGGVEPIKGVTQVTAMPVSMISSGLVWRF